MSYKLLYFCDERCFLSFLCIESCAFGLCQTDLQLVFLAINKGPNVEKTLFSFWVTLSFNWFICEWNMRSNFDVTLISIVVLLGLHWVCSRYTLTLYPFLQNIWEFYIPFKTYFAYIQFAKEYWQWLYCLGCTKMLYLHLKKINQEQNTLAEINHKAYFVETYQDIVETYQDTAVTCNIL